MGKDFSSIDQTFLEELVVGHQLLLFSKNITAPGCLYLDVGWKISGLLFAPTWRMETRLALPDTMSYQSKLVV
jgi:hypothetical protein